jgi:G patch domain-containing protein 1
MADEEDYEDDTVVVYGTPLAPLDVDSVAKKKKPIQIEEQIVTDENGRRRFHGAFTGGFSAGFYNTAGSRDGWSPAHFKSSRGEQGAPSRVQQNPQDFMDDEDLGEYGIAPQGLKTSSQFKKPEEKGDSRKRRREEENRDSAIPGQPVAIDNLFRPLTDTVGMRLLRSMGWRQGQGIGPRLTSKQKAKHAEANQRMFGCPMPPSQQGKNDSSSSDDDDDQIDPKYKAYLFAPDDVPEFVAKPKDNLFGIGYRGLDRSTLIGSGHVSLFEDPGGYQKQPALTMRGKKSGGDRAIKFSGQAFGVGAYEEEDADVYSMDNMGQYDFELAPEARDAAAAAASKKKGKSRWGDAVMEQVIKCIEGFEVSKSGSAITKKFFGLPQLPKGFVPRAGMKKSRFDEDERSQLKTTNPTPMQRLMALALPKDVVEEPKKPTQSDEQLRKLISEASVPGASGGMSSFEPFARDVDKQKRYEKFLVCAKNGRSDALHLLQPKSMTEWERERERVEFERAAALYR